ncbi:MAG TPA: metallophosphoesterase family protein [Gaiellaceae bacterium]|nr:metallophosphoesterase family protein [Gaiellaceae bacterium]
MRVAALYDIHGMVAALDAVLDELSAVEVDVLVVGGDVAAGPQPAKTLERLRALGDRVRWVRGNADREVATGDAGGLSSEVEAVIRWTAAQLTEEQRSFLGALPENVILEVTGLGNVCFCHGTPRSDEEIVTEATPDDHLRDVLAAVSESIVVAGHTHMQFDRSIDGARWVNAGSVGMPYEGEVAAFWALLGPDVELRKTSFDVDRAAEAILASGWPGADGFVRENVRTAVRREDVVPFFEQVAIDRGER